MIRLGNVAAQGTALIFALYLRTTEEASRLCQYQVVTPGASGRPPQVCSILVHSPRAGRELQGERVRREPSVGQSRAHLPRAYAQEVRGEALYLLNLHNLDGPTVLTTACDLRFEKFGPLVLHQLRHGGASHEAFTDGSAKKGAAGAASLGHVGSRRLSASHKIAPDAVSSKLGWPEAFRPKLAQLLSARCGTVSALMAQQWKRSRPWSPLTCLAFGRQPQASRTLAQTALQCHVRGSVGLAEAVAS